MKEYIMQETEEMTTFGTVWKQYKPITELVRCKDCKSYCEQTRDCEHLTIGGVDREWFCADGEHV